MFFFNDTATTEIYTYYTLFPYTTLFRSAGGGVARRPARGCRLRPPRQSPGAPSDLEAHGLSEVRRRRRARYRHHGHLRRFLLVLRALLQPARGDGAGSRAGGLLAAGRPVHRRDRARPPAPALQIDRTA